MSSLSSSSSSLSSSSPDSSTIESLSVGAIQMLPPVETSVRVNDPEDAANQADHVKESSHCLRFDWVDPKVTEFISVYRDSCSMGSFMDNHNLLKLDTANDILAIGYCRPTDTICMGQASSEGPFFFVYFCPFLDLHIALPFDDFTMGVL